MEVLEENKNNIQQELCRLCDCDLEENGEVFSIFDKNDAGQEIISLIEECLSVVVHKADSLSKCVCADCLDNLDTLYKFKKKTKEVASKHENNIQTNGENEGDNIQQLTEFAPMDGVKEEKHDSEDPRGVTKENKIGSVDAQTSTDDITILCNNCQSEILEAHKVNKELELCTELHQAIADSFSRNKIVTSDKILRSRRKRSQAFYHELDDSLCSSLTEFTNTESSQCYEFQSDIDSIGDDDDDRPVKKRKLEAVKEAVLPIISFEDKFQDDDEYIYNPLSLLQICLNVINKENIPEYEPDDYTEKLVEPECSYCSKKYKNSKLLALHEISHMGIELGEKVDNPTLWHESRDDAYIRNKWLTSEDDVMEEDNEIGDETIEGENMELEGEEEEEEEESLLIPVGSGEQRDGQNYEVTREVNLVDGKPYVDGLPLSDYPKEERRAFYHSMRIGGVNKRFCPLCRYSFKDNWAIESHYFSMACYYTCRYCGMRFNKQRNRFDEHVEFHVRNNDAFSTKVFAASKNNNVVPKVIFPKKRYSRRELVETPIRQPMEVKSFIPLHKKTLQYDVKVKQEPSDYNIQTNHSPAGQGQQQQSQSPHLQTSQSKTGNQAYFCRKCYKVFFKLDEFNIHSRNCDYNQFPNNTMLGNYLATGSKSSSNSNNLTNNEPIQTSNSGRPVRNCAKEAGPYRDELYIPDHILKEQVQTSTSQGPFICYICNTPFPTIYSRNSHMRIHKAETLRETPPSTSQTPQRAGPSFQEINNFQKTSVAHLAQVKQEPLDLEPEVEIHESLNQDSYSANLGPSVSITPISRNPNQKLQINPNVMKLVQNNPQLSIKNRENLQANHNQQMQQHLQQMLGGQSDADRTYKCSSCWEAFANKSHLYFHKKNQCEGSKYPCPFCKKRFGTEAAYSSHIFYSHPE